MDALRRYQLTNVGLFVVALAHALATWPLERTAALFLGGVAVAGVLEVIGVASGLLEHELRPQVLGVPLSVLLVWPAVVYVFYRIAALLAPSGVATAALAAVLATAADVLLDPEGVRNGVWRYPESRLSTPRFRGVPWWNYLAWLVVVFLTATLAVVAA